MVARRVGGLRTASRQFSLPPAPQPSFMQELSKKVVGAAGLYALDEWLENNCGISL